MAVPAEIIMAQMFTGGAAALKPATMNRMAATRFLEIPRYPRARAEGAPTVRIDTLPAPVNAPGMRTTIMIRSRATTRIL